MKVMVFEDKKQLSLYAADLIEKQINSKNDSKICFATGATPELTYQYLIEKYKNNKLSFKDVISFNLDEYVNLDKNNKCSYNYYMFSNLFNHIDIKKQNINLPESLGDANQNAQNYNTKVIQSGGIDFMILGIGTNGHIAFNEPGSQIDQFTRVVDLTQSTIDSNKIYFEDESQVPKQAISMGLANILQAKKIILLAYGKNKSEAIYQAINQPISAACPASFLQLHPNVTFLVDKEAISKIIKY
ncbi:glucosamine-6-phosphate deaminase [Mycoplasmopsis ciconiae]|uniref:Glucosamine-6-phosphate deaminase n=1 Tax=Mycoplasmopsis ciconiae TaxID=561067 RepID=A0ABU7MLP1_9BACT|nr:glucosamine-6-phosphate deaminase [Mycoplasmopsis ciconiae]